MSNRLFFALTGDEGTGKSTLSKYFEARHGFRTFEGSKIIKADALLAPGGPVILKGREDYNKHHRSMQMRLGAACVTQTIFAHEDDRILQSGLRTKAGFNLTKSVGGVVVALICPPEICVNRRSSDNPKDAQDIESYMLQKEMEESQDDFGTHPSYCIANADYTLDTSRPIEQTYDDIDEIVFYHTGQNH